MAAAVIQNESQRLGLENDNDFIYYTFSAELQPEAASLPVRRRLFSGSLPGGGHGRRSSLPARAWASRGRQTDSVLIMAQLEWRSGRCGRCCKAT